MTSTGNCYCYEDKHCDSIAVVVAVAIVVAVFIAAVVALDNCFDCCIGAGSCQ